VVQKGDTLFGIALDFGYDYKDVAAWNGLADASMIRVGQRLRLTPPEATDQPLVKPMGSKGPVSVEALTGTAGAAAATPESAMEPLPAEAAPAPLRTVTEPKAVTLPYTEKAYAQLGGAVAKSAAAIAAPDSRAEAKGEPKPIAAAAAVPALKEPSEAKVDPKRDAKDPAAARAGGDDDSLAWIWPAKGDLVYRFGESGNLKGVGIGGKTGQPVFAAAPGKVVYSGSGLRGYGKLVIIKHNDMYLSVYAHNSKILVKEGESVKRGQRIADMGDTDASRVALHFEIRRFGKPVDPVAQLPADRST
jgi:lipoprotein NlpD